MNNIEFKSGIYVIGYIKSFKKRFLGYSYETTKDICKAYRWRNFISCQSFYFKLKTDRIKLYENSDNYNFNSKEVIRMTRKLKLKKIQELKPWYKKD